MKKQLKNKILLINPPMSKLYKKAKVKESVPYYPPLNLLTIASPVNNVKILDMNLNDKLEKTVEEYDPDIVGITSTTPIFPIACDIIRRVKEKKEKITTIIGGSHVSSVDKIEGFDFIIKGEGDFSLINFKTSHTENLDLLPFPNWNLINPKDYKLPHTFANKNPVAPIETSRGCPFGCKFCTKSIFGRKYRAKSPERVIKELKIIEEREFKEFHIFDDGFTTDIGRAKEICKLMINEKIDLTWNCPNGVRADMLNEEILSYMKKAGCYRISIGVESGNQEILNGINKGETLETLRKSFKLCKKVGIETLAFFIFGLPGETEKTMQKTIDFAKELDPDIVKFDIFIPLPSTPIYNDWNKYIITSNWADYSFYSHKPVYNHPNLSWNQMCEYMDRAHREFYIRPKFIFKRMFKTKNIIQDFKIFFNTFVRNENK